MIHSYCNYGIYDENTGQCLEDGDCIDIDRLTYWDNGNKIVLENVQVQSISKDEITIVLEDYEEVTIHIEEIEGWE